MKTKITILLIFLVTMSFAQNGSPAAPYYNGFNWNLNGLALKQALTTKITATHTSTISWAGTITAMRQTDVDPENPNNVLLIYGWENGTDSNVTNDRSRSKFSNGGANGDWNREHTFANSNAEPDLDESNVTNNDIQNLRSSDVQRNGYRANLKFATGSGNSGFVTDGWYPGDEWKGDVARIVMYMYVRYGEQCSPKFNAIGTLNSIDDKMVNLLLQWNAEDPVSQYEDNRNTFGQPLQGNRNPFIDNPYLAFKIWGGPIPQDRWNFLSTSESEQITFSIYPTIVSDRINIVNPSETNLEYQIFNEVGQMVQSGEAEKIIDLRGNFKGLYFVIISDKENKKIFKIIAK